MTNVAAAAKPSDRIGTDEIRRRLRVKYPKNSHALFFEVRNGTGYEKSPRSADAVCMGLYPSHGMELIGFEFKASRADWKKELTDPTKSDEIGKYCDRWYLIAGDSSIVYAGELPPAWGLMIPYRDGLRVSVEAPKRETAPIDRLFLGSMMRQLQKSPFDDAEVIAEMERRVAEAKRSQVHNIEWRERGFNELKAKVVAFEAASGVRIQGWREGADIGIAVRFVLEGGLAQAEKRLEKIRDAAQTALVTVEAAIKAKPSANEPDQTSENTTV